MNIFFYIMNISVKVQMRITGGGNAARCHILNCYSYHFKMIVYIIKHGGTLAKSIEDTYNNTIIYINAQEEREERHMGIQRISPVLLWDAASETRMTVADS